MDEPDATGSGASAAPAPQFRTYASDVAKLTGSHTPLSRDAHSSLPSSPAPARKPAPMPPTAPPAAPPAPVAPYEPPPADIIPKAPSTDESREAVLARLRAKAAPAAQSAAAPARVIPNAPSTTEAREEVLARLRSKTASAPAPARPAPPPGIPTLAKDVPAPAPIHTYKSDFSEKAKATGASKISILAAEQNAQGRTTVPTLRSPKKNYLPLIIGAVALILAGGASVYFAFAFVTGHPPVIIAPSVPSLIFADEHAELKGTSYDLQKGLVDLASRSLPSGGVAVAYITYSTTTAKGDTVTLPAEGGALISAMGLPAPQILLRNVDAASTVGVVHAGEETRPFFLLRVASFERTFAGMLDWEPSMAADLLLFYPPYPAEVQEPVGTSTGPVLRTEESIFSVSFVDEVVDNHDVRVLRDASGRSVLLYGYRDKQTLIIARDEAAFSELLKRLASTRAQ